MRNAEPARRWIGIMLAFIACWPSARADETLEAVWQHRRATFVYAGHTTFYTCRALEAKLTRVLRALGAQDDMIFDRRECQSHGSTRLHVTFRSPVEATAENIRALTTYDTEAVLVARLRGLHLRTAEDLERFPASWREVSLGDRNLRMGAGDCELIEHVRRQLLPHLSTRVLKNRIFCTPGAHAVRPPRLVVAALMADSHGAKDDP